MRGVRHAMAQDRAGEAVRWRWPNGTVDVGEADDEVVYMLIGLWTDMMIPLVVISMRYFCMSRAGGTTFSTGRNGGNVFVLDHHAAVLKPSAPAERLFRMR